MADRAAGVPFAKEGFPFIGAAAGITLIAGLLGWLPIALAAAVLTLFVSWFFRNPPRVIPQGAGLVVSPGDGKVLAVEEEFEPRYLKERAVRMVREHQAEYGSVTKRSDVVGERLGVSRETLRRWVAQQDVDDGVREGVTSAELEEIATLKAENPSAA